MKIIKLSQSNTATIFFVPFNPKSFEKHIVKGDLQHTGVIYNGTVYETFNHGKFNVESESTRKPELEKQNAIFFQYPIIPNKLSEVNSGTSCEQFVLRVMGKSNLIGPNKGSLYPQDVHDLYFT